MSALNSQPKPTTIMSNPVPCLEFPGDRAGRCLEPQRPASRSLRSRLLGCAFFAALCLAGGLSSASGAGITFGPGTTAVGDADVYAYGSLRYAFNQANAASTVNGVPFAAGTSQTTLGGGSVTMSGYTGGANTTAFGTGVGAPWSGLSAAYQIVLRGGTYTTAGTPAVNNLNVLTAGRQYAVQFWVNDNRSCCFTRTETVAGGNNTVSLAYNAILAQGGVGQYTIGYFTAGGTTQSFTNTSAVSSQFNAIQLRDVTGSWSGTASGDWDAASLNFSGLSYSGVTGLGVTAVSFTDKDANGATPMNTTVTMAAGGQTGANILFQNFSVPFTVNSSDAIGLAGAFGVTKVGGAAATLGGTHTYTGPTAVSAGSLTFNGSSTLPGLVTLASGATLNLNGGNTLSSLLTLPGGATLNLTGNNSFNGGLAVSGLATGPATVGVSLSGAGTAGAIQLNSGATVTPGNAPSTFGTLSLGDLTLGAATTLNFDIGATTTPGAGVNDLIQVAGGFTNNGTVTVNFSFVTGLPVLGVPYTLITSAALDPAFNPASFVTGASHITPVFSVSGNNVQVTFTAGNNNVVWQGDPAGGTNWASGTLGWTNLAGNGSLDFYYNADNAIFNDTATNVSVNVTGTVFPASVTVNSTSNYLFAGAGGISGGGGLTKDGSGVLTLTNVNTHTGPTVVNAGTLRYNTTASQPTATPLVVAGGAVLDLNVVAVATTATWSSTNTLSGSGLVRVNTGSGANNVILRNIMSGFTGTLDLIPAPSGKLNLSQMGASPAPSATLRVNTGSSVFLASGRNLLCNVELFGGVTGEAFGQLRIDGNTTNFGPILLRANTTIGNQGGAAALGYINGVISDGGLGFGFSKQGTGIIVLSAPNTFSGQTAFPAATASIRLNHINALAQSTVNLTVANGLSFNPTVENSFTLGGLTGNAALALQNTAAAAINLSVGNNNASTTYSAALSGVGSLTKIGSGVLTLGASSTHTGTTFANAGLLQLGAAGALTVSTIQVGPAGTFDGSLVTGGFAVRANQNLTGFGVVTGAVTVPVNAAIAPGTVGAAGTLSFSNALTLTNGTLRFDLANSTTAGGGVNDLIAMSGPLTLGGTNLVQLNLLAGAMAEGDYTLITGITSVPSGGVANIQLASPVRPAITFALVDQAAPGVSGVTNLTMSVSGTGGSVAWVGTNALWDAGVTFNWKNLGTLLADRYFTFDQVLFDDSLAANPSVSLVGALFPLSVTVNNVNSNYTFAGSGRISGATGVTKDGAGTLVVSTANDYAGPTVIRGGTLRPTVGTALGSVAGATFVTNSGTLDTGAQNLGNELVVISGAGAGGGGAIRNSGADQTQTLTALRLAGDASVNGPNRWDVRGSVAGGASVDLNGYTLTKTGTNFVSFVNARVTNNGSIVVQQGTLAFEVGTTVAGSGLVTVPSASSLFVGDWGSVLTLTKPLALNGGLLASATTGVNGTCGLDSPISLLADSPVNVLATATITLRGAVGGAGGLTKQGPGTLAFSNTNTYLGLTAIDGGVLRLNATGSISNSAGVRLAAGTILDASARGGLSFGNGQSLSGSGSVLGAVTATAGSQVNPGGVLPGTLVVSNGLSLTDVAAMDFQIGSVTNEGAGFNDLIQVLGALALSGVNTVRVSVVGTPVVGNAYTLFSYTGAFTGAAGNLTVVTETRHTFAIDLSVPNKVRIISTGGAGSLLWVGGNPDNVWDSKATANWDPGTGNPDVFFPGDVVSFVNGSFYPAVGLVGQLQPSDVNAFADDNYLFEGTGKINGGRLNKSGSGTLTLANNDTNSFAFGTLISQGTLQIGNGGTTGALPLGPLTNNATLAFDRSDDVTLNTGITGSGYLRKQGANTLTLAGANSHAGGSIVASGTLRVQNNTALGALATAITTVSNGATLDLGSIELWNYVQPLVINGAGVGGAGAIVKSAPGVGGLMQLRNLTLGSDASLGGVATARIDIGRGDWPGAVPVAPIHLDGQGNTLSLVGNVYLGILAGAQNLSGVIIGSGTTLAPHNDNSLGSATVTLNGGNLSPWGANRIFANPLVLNSGFLDNQAFSHTYTGPVQVNGPIQVNPISGGNITFNGTITGAGGITKVGPFTVLLGGDNSGFTGSYTNNESNTFFTSDTAGSAQASWVMTNGNLAHAVAGDHTIQLGSLAGSGGRLGNNLANPDSGRVTFVLGGNNASTAFAGQIVDTVGQAGTAALVKTGLGTQILSGTNNTYSGGTLVSAGTLRYDGTLAAGPGAVTVAGGTLAGNGALNVPVQIDVGGTLAPGASIGILTINSALVLAGTTAMEINKATLTNDLIRGLSSVTNGGTLQVTNLGGVLNSGDSFKLFDAASYGGSFASLQLPELSPGLVWNPTRLLIDGTLSVNGAPVASNLLLRVARNQATAVAISKVLTHASDPDGDPLTLASVTDSTNGAVVAIAGTDVVYTPVTNFSGLDQFTYTVSDGRGGSATALINVEVYPGSVAGVNMVSIRTVPGGIEFTFAGIPGRTYGIERAPLVTGPWTNIGSAMAGPTGLNTFTDTNAPPGSAFYRTVYP